MHLNYVYLLMYYSSIILSDIIFKLEVDKYDIASDHNNNTYIDKCSCASAYLNSCINS